VTATTDAYRLLCDAGTFVVIDVETCPSADGDRIVSIAAVTVRQGQHRGVWATLVNPGVPITNSHIHHLTDTDVADAPPFAEIAGQLDKVLAADDVYFVAHHARSDVGVLHLDHARAGLSLRDVPVLDTMKLPPLVGHDVGKGNIGLARLATSLGLTHTRPHDATADATVTTDVLLRLLNVAAGNGLADLAGLHADSGALTTATIPPSKATTAAAAVPVEEIPSEHAATHATLLEADATAADIDTWVAGALECAQWRCDLLDDKARHARHHAPVLHRRLTAELARFAPAAEPGQGATLLGALNVLAADGVRPRSAMLWWRKNRTLVHGLPRCDTYRCPACRRHEPCPIDVSHHAIVETVCVVDGIVPRKTRMRVAESHRRCLVTDWSRLGLPELAGYAAALVATAWSDEGNNSRVVSTVDLAVTSGAFDPTLIRFRAQHLANQTRTAELTQLVTDALEHRDTAPGWADLDAWWITYQAARRPRVAKPAARPGASIRVARPADRSRPKRFVV
jgi:DNA polymerase III epsilon subunit-like protein